MFTELRQVRLTGFVKLPVESLSGMLANLPDGVSVERSRIEVRFDGAKNAMERLYALAHALVNGYEAVSPLHVAAYIRTHPGSAPTAKQHLAAPRWTASRSRRPGRGRSR